MKSPFTGGETELIREPKSLEFRKESFEITHHSYRCIDTGEYFTTDELDQVNITQVHNKYREKHNIPFPDQIISIRDKYGLSATKMSEILGFGVNTYRNYEGGEVPQASNAKLIKLASNPEKFKSLVEMSDVLTDNEYNRLITKIDQLIEEEKTSEERYLRKLLSEKHWEPGILTGYRQIQLERFCNMVVFFAEKISPYKTRLNKLMFYADFLNYKKTGFSISGTDYKAIEMGPVPDGYDTLYDYFNRNKMIHIQYDKFVDKENVGERFLPNPDRPFESELFSEGEIKILDFVADYFKDMSTQDIIDRSHEEKAWKQKAKDEDFIEYDYAFDLSVGD